MGYKTDQIVCLVMKFVSISWCVLYSTLSAEVDQFSTTSTVGRSTGPASQLASQLVAVVVHVHVVLTTVASTCPCPCTCKCTCICSSRSSTVAVRVCSPQVATSQLASSYQLAITTTLPSSSRQLASYRQYWYRYVVVVATGYMMYYIVHGTYVLCVPAVIIRTF